MTLDDIIEYFEKTGTLGPKGYGLAELELRTAALLKAGKAMREGISVKDYSGNTATLKHPSAVGEAARAWDKATEAEV